MIAREDEAIPVRVVFNHKRKRVRRNKTLHLLHLPRSREFRPTTLRARHFQMVNGECHLVLAETAQTVHIVHVLHSILEEAVFQTLVRSEVANNHGTVLVKVFFNSLVILNQDDLILRLLTQIEQDITRCEIGMLDSLHTLLSLIHLIVSIMEEVQRRELTNAVDLSNGAISRQVDLWITQQHITHFGKCHAQALVIRCTSQLTELVFECLRMGIPLNRNDITIVAYRRMEKEKQVFIVLDRRMEGLFIQVQNSIGILHLRER